jgi:hypothetical protein
MVTTTCCIRPSVWCISSQNHQAIVDHYLDCQRWRYQAELNWFAQQSSLRGAIARAAIARGGTRTRCGKRKRLSHQWRIRHSSLIGARRALLADLPKPLPQWTFDDLYDFIGRTIRPSGASKVGLGAVYQYDTALRIAAWFKVRVQRGLYPANVYLHAGSLDGARRLVAKGILPPIGPRNILPWATVPPPFNTLEPYEVENILCLYKRCF